MDAPNHNPSRLKPVMLAGMLLAGTALGFFLRDLTFPIRSTKPETSAPAKSKHSVPDKPYKNETVTLSFSNFSADALSQSVTTETGSTRIYSNVTLSLSFD